MHRRDQETLKEYERTKRLLIAVAAFCLISGAALIVFAPAGKESVSYVIAGATMILSLGAIGVQEFKIKTLGVRIAGGREAVRSEAPFQASESGHDHSA